jgi:phage terminase large subunit GpA-like protein
MTGLQQAFYHALTPPPNLSVSEWADQFRVLSPEACSEPGQWNTNRAPHLRAIMDAITDPSIQEIVFMKSSQVGGTEVLLNAIGYTIDLNPGPVLLIQPTLEMGEAFSKDRLEPMLRDTPVLREKVSQNRKDASSTIRHKTFGGGHVTIAGSNSAAGLASRPVRDVYADEVDRWEANVGDEGDPLALAWKRATTFWNRKLIVVSTPGVKGISRIEAKYTESDQRQCFVACPHCATRHVLKWANVKWTPNDPESAHLVCPECGCEIDEVQRHAMLQDPEWRPTAEFHGTAGFHIWECYSPWRRLADIVADFLEAKKAPDTLQVFVNTSLGETWEETAEQADTSALIARREPYPATVPAGACCLTSSVDVQDDRLEALVVGWGPGEESWIIDTRAFPGDPQRPEPWRDLDELLATTFQHESGAFLEIKATCIDTAGHRTQFAYDYVLKHQHQRVYGIIGRAGSDEPIVSAPMQKHSGKDPRRIPMFKVGVDTCKALIYSRLKITANGTGYIHLPLPHQTKAGEHRAGVDEEFIAQLTAEKLVTKHKNGIPARFWQQMRPRNEALDLMVYNIAALRLLRPDLAAMAALLNPSAAPRPVPAFVPAPRTPWIQRSPRGNWLHGRR